MGKAGLSQATILNKHQFTNNQSLAIFDGKNHNKRFCHVWEVYRKQ